MTERRATPCAKYNGKRDWCTSYEVGILEIYFNVPLKVCSEKCRVLSNPGSGENFAEIKAALNATHLALLSFL